uniref:Uncharacterized protein n=1 Tax=Oryza glumipatula TaxID=40148 RepID=A0A0E0A0Y3_9ORYZ
MSSGHLNPQEPIDTPGFFGPTVTTLLGMVILLRALLRYPSSFGKEFWVKTLSSLWMDDDGVIRRRDLREGVISQQISIKNKEQGETVDDEYSQAGTSRR